MDNIKTGLLIKKLRLEKGFTQLVLAEKIGVSDKAVSKWERGLGCPDVSLLCDVAKALGVNVNSLLNGNVSENEKDGGNMKNQRFYYCEHCGNTIISTGNAEVSCCGKKLEEMKINTADDKHSVAVENVEDEIYVTMNHEMIKSHFITFVAYQSFDRFYMIKTYPEQDLAVRLPGVRGGRILVHCSKDGLYETKL